MTAQGPYRDGFDERERPNVLICSALDPSGGAGFIADVRVVGELGARPIGVVTAMTVQNTQGMRSCHDLDADVLGVQLSALLTDIEVRAVKLGILGSEAVIRELGDNLELTAAPVVWDPVIGPTQGNVSFAELVDLALLELGPHLSLITPNLAEMSAIAKTPLASLAEAQAAAEVFCGVSKIAVLVKGGHLGSDESVDVLCYAGGVEYLRSPRIATDDVHGTGCALSSAVATHLALGAPLVEACRRAKHHVTQKLASPLRPGRGAPAIV